jgi:cytochrome c-type biogenesis protein CcmE
MKTFYLLSAVFGLILCAGIGAQERFTVQSVAGNVEREVSPGNWEAVKVGDVLTADTVIRTRLNSSLVIRIGERSSTVNAMQRGVLNDLVRDGSTGGVTINGNITETDTTRRSTTDGASPTAAARGSEVVAELILLDE